MTEYGDVEDMIECANLIHNSLVVEQVSGYNHWSLVWPGKGGGLIQIENPYATQSPGPTRRRARPRSRTAGGIPQSIGR